MLVLSHESRPKDSATEIRSFHGTGHRLYITTYVNSYLISYNLPNKRVERIFLTYVGENQVLKDNLRNW